MANVTAIRRFDADSGWYLSDVQQDGELETVEETLTLGSARIEASRRILDDLDRRLTRGSQLLGDDAESASAND